MKQLATFAETLAYYDVNKHWKWTHPSTVLVLYALAGKKARCLCIKDLILLK